MKVSRLDCDDAPPRDKPPGFVARCPDDRDRSVPVGPGVDLTVIATMAAKYLLVLVVPALSGT